MKNTSHQSESKHHEQFVRFKGNVGTYFVIVNKGMVDKWKTDKNIKIDDVVQSYHIFKGENPGTQAAAPSKGELQSDFGTSKDVEVIQQILTNGEIVGH